MDTIVFAKGHKAETFADLLLADKPRIYLSYHITEATEETLRKVQIIRDKMMPHFICIDPYAIRDWDIVAAFDQATQTGRQEVSVAGITLTVNEIEEAINEIRAQIVSRDYDLIESTHATVVCHLAEHASYGVMSEIIHTRMAADNPVYAIVSVQKTAESLF